MVPDIYRLVWLTTQTIYKRSRDPGFGNRWNIHRMGVADTSGNGSHVLVKVFVPDGTYRGQAE